MGRCTPKNKTGVTEEHAREKPLFDDNQRDVRLRDGRSASTGGRSATGAIWRSVLRQHAERRLGRKRQLRAGQLDDDRSRERNDYRRKGPPRDAATEQPSTRDQ